MNNKAKKIHWRSNVLNLDVKNVQIFNIFSRYTTRNGLLDTEIYLDIKYIFGQNKLISPHVI